MLNRQYCLQVQYTNHALFKQNPPFFYIKQVTTCRINVVSWISHFLNSLCKAVTSRAYKWKPVLSRNENLCSFIHQPFGFLLIQQIRSVSLDMGIYAKVLYMSYSLWFIFSHQQNEDRLWIIIKSTIHMLIPSDRSVTTFTACGFITGNVASWDVLELGARVISLVKHGAWFEFLWSEREGTSGIIFWIANSSNRIMNGEVICMSLFPIN